jgi:hypothetical protein
MNFSYRSAGLSAIASGVVGVVAYVFLIGFLVLRNGDAQDGAIAIRVHDTCVILQFLFLIPVANALFALTQQQSAQKSPIMLYTGIGALCFTILFLLLIFPKVFADTLYMFPQGLFGIWLIISCWRLKKLIPQWLRWFGIIVGFGLALVATFPVGYAIFVDPIILHVPAPSNQVMNKIPAETTANILLHQFLTIGSLMGVITLPIWTMLIGVRLYKMRG